ncbi:Metal-dependent hydrolase, endonuclease/exonuclease/phosphatase family [Kaistia soli DSM 19436]|uniref:Metal-dependent hydrolase, endonuclease/exonuclease/phosphatase family n=1 Tax=Kaistia soli DSM 19436 TaxID=1122133 RepID=A0A1M5IJ22_9HYPH|nr:endonuclease/exonuclease/phosphatase family protein [Kaistia soli]SHG28348.1 Metal-dependent hydrolase, endonuclease/exonuclease/phosphatase family [Kaistia soli DSM 19436]
MTPGSPVVRILSYNVHSCIGTDGQLAPERIAAVIAESAPDIVLLQEVDVGRLRTGGLDQAHQIAEALAMQRHFHPALSLAEEHYGDAVLTRLPMTLVKAGALTGPRRLAGEPRGALRVSVEVEGHALTVVNTHLGLLPHEQAPQIRDLLGPFWAGDPALVGPVVLGGDFNAFPGTPSFRRIAQGWTNAYRRKPAGGRGATFPSLRPWLRLDHLWFRGPLRVSDAFVVASPLARRASDHLPLVADFEFAV